MTPASPPSNASASGIARSPLWVALFVTGLLLSGCALERPLPEVTPPRVVTPTPTASVAASDVATPLPSPTATIEILGVATEAASGREVKFEPGASDVVWWTSRGDRRNHIGDSFLYSGFADDSAFVSAVRFDLSRVQRGAPIASGSLEMRGLRADRLKPEAGGSWSVQLLAGDAVPDFRTADYQAIVNAPAAAMLLPTLFPADLGENVTNTWDLDPSALRWVEDQILNGHTDIWARIIGPTGGTESLFAWDSGYGPETRNARPRLLLSTELPQGTPGPVATQPFVIGTAPPTPMNVFTAAADALTATVEAAAGTTPTRSPRYQTVTPIAQNVATAQALAALLGQPPIVAVMPSPANGATATAEAAYATAVAIATGTYTPTPEGAVTAIIVIPTPQPANVATAAAQIVTAVAHDRLIGTVTPLPFNAVLATLTPGLEVATSTPRPSNAATVQALANYATAVAMTTGTFTPQPARPITPTFTPVATPVPLVIYQDFTVPTATPIPDSAPRQLTGKILFQSDRPPPAGLPGGNLWIYDPATRAVGYVTQSWVFNRAEAADRRTASGEGVQSLSVEADADNNFQIFLINNRTNQRTQLTEAKADSYDPAWRPGGQQFAFVSQESGNDEIYTMTPDGENRRQLTVNQWEWDKHPSYSSDGSQIVFSSNRGTGRRQIWIMNADGSNQRLLFPSQFEDYAPVWVK